MGRRNGPILGGSRSGNNLVSFRVWLAGNNLWEIKDFGEGLAVKDFEA